MTNRRHVEEEKENHERWLISYADMVTLLFALFVLLFAISQVNNEKYEELSTSLATAFGTALFGFLIDIGFSVSDIATVSGFYIFTSLILLFLIRKKLNPIII